MDALFAVRPSKICIQDSWRRNSSGTNHELLVLPLQHDTGVVLPAFLLYNTRNEVPFLVLEGLLDFAFGRDQMTVVFLLDDREIRPVCGSAFFRERPLNQITYFKRA